MEVDPQQSNATLTTEHNLSQFDTTDTSKPLINKSEDQQVSHSEAVFEEPELTATNDLSPKCNPVPSPITDEKLSYVDAGLYEKAKTPENPHPECQLLFVIHGIGATPKKLSDRIVQLGKMLQHIRRQKKNRYKTPVHIKILDWKSTLNNNVKESIEKATLRSNPLERKMLNQIPTDLLFYLTPEHALVIINEVVSQANQCYKRFKEAFPNMKVSIIGHSLGSVILYDIISQNFEKKFSKTEIPTDLKFNFTCEEIFIIGSPLSMFLSINGEKVKQLDKEGYCKGFYNIFHPNDLLAYRVEPLMHGYPSYDALSVPYIVNDGAKRKKEPKNNSSFFFLSFCTSREKPEAPGDSFVVGDSSVTRYDYVIQETVIEYMFETLGIIGGHWGYWENEDLFYFLLNKLELK